VYEFLEKWQNEEQTPSSHVTKMVEYFDENEREHVKYLLQRQLDIRRKDEIIRHQQQEINEKDKELKEKDAFIKSRNEKLANSNKENSELTRRLELLELFATNIEKEKAPASNFRGSAASGSGPMSKLINDANEINNSIIATRVRVNLQCCGKYLLDKEYSAIAKLATKMEDLLVSKLPTDDMIHGKALYWKGRGMFGLGFCPEAVEAFGNAIAMGLGPDRGEAEGDDVKDWWEKARIKADEYKMERQNPKF
jgi:hypothetical protein